MLAFLFTHAELVVAVAGWLAAVCGWLFSAAMSSCPPLPANCSFKLRWLHDWAQLLAANLHKRSQLDEKN